MSQNGLVSIFLVFCHKLDFQKAQRIPSSTFFGTMKLLKILIFRFLSEKVLLSPKCPDFNFLDIVQQTGFSKKLKGSSFLQFSAL